MEHLQKKLHSERGASILLALLLFLVCCMAAASILAAAGSNAGKTRSSRTEYQKQLTLSCALQLVCGELEKAQYTGKYKTYEWTESAGSVSTNHFYCEQAAGAYACGLLTDQLPLGKELDEIFSRQFTARGSGYRPLSGSGVEGQATRTLTVTLPDGLDGYPYPGSGPAAYTAPQEATVTVTLNHATRHITVKAWLGTGGAPADGSDTLIAELTAGTAPALDYTPAGRFAESAVPASATPAVAEKTTDPVGWKLNWIKKGAS